MQLIHYIPETEDDKEVLYLKENGKESKHWVLVRPRNLKWRLGNRLNPNIDEIEETFTSGEPPRYSKATREIEPYVSIGLMTLLAERDDIQNEHQNCEQQLTNSIKTEETMPNPPVPQLDVDLIQKLNKLKQKMELADRELSDYIKEIIPE